MSWIIIVPFLSLGIYLLLFLSLIQRLKGTTSGRIFAAILLASTAWSFSSWMMHVGAAPSPHFWLTTGFVFLQPLSPLMLHFATEYPRHKYGLGWLVLLWYGIALVFGVSTLLGQVVERADLVPASGGVVDIKFGPIWNFAGWPYMTLTIIVMAIIFAHSYRSTNSRVERQLLRYPLVSTLLLFGGGLLNVLPALRGYPVDFLAFIVFSLVIAYAISRNQFLNVRVILRRNQASIILVLASSAMFILILRLIQRHVSEASGFYLWLMMAPIAAALVFTFYVTNIWLQSKIDRLFFSVRYDYRQTLLEFSHKMGSNLNLDSLAKDLLTMICNSLNCAKASLCLPASKGDFFEVRASLGFGDKDSSGEICVPNNDPLLIFARKYGRLLSKAEIEIMAGPGNVLLMGKNHWLTALGCELLCPLMIRDNLVGFILLGKKRSSEQFSDEDILLLSTVSQQAAVAVDNARLYAESQRAYADLRQTQQDLVRSERMRAVGQMAGGVAHDFNNILTTILTRAELALDKVGRFSEAKNDLEIIQRAALDGAQVTRRVQEFAKAKSGIEYVPLDTKDVVKSTLSLVEHRIAELHETKGVSVDIFQSLRSVRSVLGNAADLRQALFNIVINALEAMPNGGRIDIATEDSGEWVCVSVSDTGTGMSREVREKIFEPMFTTKGSGNTGLGLTVTANIVEQHKGRVEVNAEPGKGSTFRMVLPAASGPAQTASAPTGTYSPKKGDILIIDDDKEVLESLRLTLNGLGHNTACATDGSNGLALAQRKKFDLVITDLGMPDMGGADVAVSLKDMRPDMPILLITGWGVQIDSKQLKEMKIQGILSKPFTREEVAKAVDRLLETKVNGPS